MNSITSPEPFPEYINHLSDYRWCRELAGFIAADLLKLSGEDRQIVYEDLIDLRLWTHERAAG